MTSFMYLQIIHPSKSLITDGTPPCLWPSNAHTVIVMCIWNMSIFSLGIIENHIRVILNQVVLLLD